MKLQCDVEVVNRMLPTFGMKSRGKGTRAVLSIGKHTDKTSQRSSVYMMICTAKDRAGSKYKLKDNIEKFFTWFVEEGKATVRLKEPAVDICLSKPAAHVEEWCVQGRGGPASREAWSGHSMTSLEGTRAAMAPLSLSPIWPPHLSHPSIHSSQCFLPARVPAAASHVTIEPGLDGCCSESREREREREREKERESPIWASGETEEKRDVDREEDDDTPDVFKMRPNIG
ncbi:Leucine-rich repeat protein 1 4-1BB-mediated-signaling molecule 4-1BBlrr LRR-repeat protein 1 [Larimichthys crocea]|uniref:Leucine-rich repeat protein 1 4-1BB-mediated-signaling molecule 4-1BBlrr LRR-repeat protein 1 n=1 Tax=Larimichthys crocea TaxID=215358 RepID=A0A6G0IEM7_LARCR|nr:Leucine-rich repeat protein 1 4-1BB-mediated-signaling molecule 4-1BBlrr LRR-repeat protein 1 [Larimichthys crocea]